MIQQLFTLSRHTFLESIRQPIFVVLILIGALALVLNPSLAAYTLDDDNKLLVDMGLSTLFLAGLMMAAFTATAVLSSELENQTALTVISKPIHRPIFVLGKYLGVSAAITVAYWSLCAIFLLTVRHRVMQTATSPFDGPVLLFGIGAAMLALIGATLGNYFYQTTFTSTFVLALSALMTVAWVLVLMIDKQWLFQSPAVDLSPQLMIGLFLILQAVLILTAVAITASTRLGQLMTLTACVLVFVLGLISDYLFGKFDAAYMPFYLITPNLQLFWPADAMTQGRSYTPGYVGLVTGYAVLYITAMMGLAVSLFQQRELM